MNPTERSLYRDLLGQIKTRVRQAQHRAALSANAQMILMYWDIGRLIAARQQQEGWGAGVIPRLAADLKNELPDEKGFSERNIKRMLAFYRAYPIVQRPAAQLQSITNAAVTIVPQLAAQLSPIAPSPILPQPTAKLQTPEAQGVTSEILFSIPWFHHVILIEKLKDEPTRLWYALQAAEHGWSRGTLLSMIRSQAHLRQGSAISNFSATLPAPHASIAQQLLKDPYIFDFLTLEEPFHERELETGLLSHIQKFLLELGRGFAFVGRQYPLHISDKDFYLDLLFYHLNLRCFIVIELKKGDFKPEYAGKMNFYCSAVDDLLRHGADQPTIGLILCQTKDRILAEYTLRDIHKPIGIADYELTRALPEELASSLPSIEQIEAELQSELPKQSHN